MDIVKQDLLDLGWVAHEGDEERWVSHVQWGMAASIGNALCECHSNLMDIHFDPVAPRRQTL
jgi:hypothetical protein